MKTKIEYTFDLKDIPNEIKEKFSGIVKELEKISHYVESIGEDLEQENISIIARRIDSSRRRLYHVDNLLDDCDQAIKVCAAAVAQVQEQHAQQLATQDVSQPPEQDG